MNSMLIPDIHRAWDLIENTKKIFFVQMLFYNGLNDGQYEDDLNQAEGREFIKQTGESQCTIPIIFTGSGYMQGSVVEKLCSFA